MIKFENTEVFGWEASIRGLRNPLNSWHKSDSRWDGSFNYYTGNPCWKIGPNDLDLMKRLIKAGSDHSKFMRMINVTMDITAPLYWWKEFDTYKIGTVANSCSTMHKIHEKEFTLEDFSYEHLIEASRRILKETISILNVFRLVYINYDKLKNKEIPVSKEVEEILNDISKKDIWWQMIQLLPSSYNQKRTVQLNYAVLRNIYHAREYHKLDEWRSLCDWIKTLPYSELITDDGSEYMIYDDKKIELKYDDKSRTSVIRQTGWVDNGQD